MEWTHKFIHGHYPVLGTGTRAAGIALPSNLKGILCDDGSPIDPEKIFIFTDINPMAGNQYSTSGTQPVEWVQTKILTSEKANEVLQVKSLRLQKGAWSCIIRPKANCRLVQGQWVSDLYFRVKSLGED